MALRVPLLGQGQFAFVTYLPQPFGGVDIAAAVFDRDGATLLIGARYSAQFYAGPKGAADDQLVSVGDPRTFARENTIPGGGYFPKFDPLRFVVVPGVPAGSPARLQLRIWDNENGIQATYENAALRSVSESFDSRPLADAKVPISITLPVGLKSFQLPAAPPANAPVKASFVALYANSHYCDPFGGFIAGSSGFRS